MTKDKIRIAVAELCGWKKLPFKSNIGHKWVNHTRGSISVDTLPNYHESLDACREFERTITVNEIDEYLIHIDKVTTPVHICATTHAWNYFQADAIHRCEAFLRLHGQWVEDAK